MKKALISMISILCLCSSARAQEQPTADIGDKVAQQIGETINQATEQLTERMTDTIQPVLGEFINGLSKMAVMFDVCMNEDKAMPTMTQEMAENIVKAAAPYNTTDFVITTDKKTFEDFAKANFNTGESQVTIQLARSHCLIASFDAMSIMDDTVNNIKTKVQDGDTSIEEQNNDKAGILIANDNVPLDKFVKTNINNIEIMKAVDREKQVAYVFGFVGTLGIRIKVANGNYEQVAEQILQQINVPELQGIIGTESVSEIKARLNTETEKKIRELNEKIQNDKLTAQQVK